MEKLKRFLRKFLKRKSEANENNLSASVSSPLKKEKRSLLLFPNCKIGEGKEWSFVFEHFRVRLEEKKEGYAVLDPTSKKWIVFKKREKVKTKPIFPLALELAKKHSDEFTALRIFVTADCGAVDLTVVPQMDKVNEKFKVTKARKQEIETLRNNVVLAFINSLTMKPFLLLTNDSKIKELIEKKIDSLPRPEPQKEEMKKKMESSLVVTEDIVEYLFLETAGSNELSIPKELEITKQQAVALGLLFALLVGGYAGYSYYQKKKEEEEMKRLTQQQVWTPSPQFKKGHLFYKEFQGELIKLLKVVYSLNKNVKEVSINGDTVKIVYYFKTPVVNSKKDKKGFRKEETFTVSYTPSWESLREEKPFYLPKAVAIYKSLPKELKEAVSEVTEEDIEGIKLLCFSVDYFKKIPAYDVQRMLIFLPLPYKIDELQLTKNEENYLLSFRGKFCGLEE